jgi:hypothetical protein
MNRRDILTLVGLAAGCWPLRLGAQQSARLPLVGVFGGAVAAELDAFYSSMRDLGYVEGRNVSFAVRRIGPSQCRCGARAGGAETRRDYHRGRRHRRSRPPESRRCNLDRGGNAGRCRRTRRCGQPLASGRNGDPPQASHPLRVSPSRARPIPPDPAARGPATALHISAAAA